MALSSCEPEYVAAFYAACHVALIEMLLEELKVTELKKMDLFVDTKSTIDLANHPISHGRRKHTEKMYHFSERSNKQREE